jgi:hypothetical protein
MMGQYRQWLHYREMDQQLHIRLEQVEKHATELEADIHRLADDSCSSTNDNVIMQALVRMYTTLAQEQIIKENAPAESRYTTTPVEPGEIEQNNDVSTESLSWAASALFAQSYLTNFDAFDPSTLQSLSPYAETGLLPEDLAIFFTGLPHNGNDGQHYPANASLTASHSAVPVDKQSLRNDRLIQRWFERWGQSTNDQELSQEGQGL